MNKLFKTILITLIAVFSIGFLFRPSTFAQAKDLDVEFETPPLFSEGDFKPGDCVIRWIKVTNKSGETKPIATEAINYPGFTSTPRPHPIPDTDLSRALSIIIREKDGSDLYGGSKGAKTLYDFYQNGETYLSDISARTFKKYEFEICFPSEKGNEWQKKKTNFDILIGFQGTEGGPPPPPPPPPPSPPPPPGFYIPPGLTIQYERTICVSDVDAIIEWRTSYKSTSRVVYDTVSGVFDLDNLPNYGYAFSTPEEDNIPPISENGVTVHIVEITGLTPSTTYYYRAISHASPPTISQERSFNTLAPGERSPCCVEEEKIVPPPIVILPPPEELIPPLEEIIPPPEEIIPPIEAAPPEVEEKPVEELVEKRPPPLVAAIEIAIGDLEKILGPYYPCLQKILGPCYHCFPWWLILIFALFSLIKGARALEKSKKETNLILKDYFKKAGIIWSISSLIPIILAIWFFLIHYYCLAVWVFLILAFVALLGWWIDTKILNRKIKEATGQDVPPEVRSRQRSILITGVVFLLILLIIWLILKCLTLLLILLLLLLFYYLLSRKKISSNSSNK